MVNKPSKQNHEVKRPRGFGQNVLEVLDSILELTSLAANAMLGQHWQEIAQAFALALPGDYFG